MPLAQKPHRPKPEVQLLRRRRISFEEAHDFLQQGLSSPSDGSSKGTEKSEVNEEAFLEVPGSYLVSYRSIPAIVDSLRDEWVKLPQKKRPKSCFVEVVGRLECHLHPCFLSQLALGLRGAAGFLLHRYIETLGCIPLGFMELRPAGTMAALVAESPYVHFFLQFRAVGFAPDEGDWLVGRASVQQVDAGLNVSLLGLLNCHVTQRNLPQDLQFDRLSRRWLDTRGLSDEEKEKGEGKEPRRVWLKLVKHLSFDKMLRFGSSVAPEVRCELGWPPEDVPERIQKEEAASRQEKRKRAKALNAGADAEPARPKAEVDDEDGVFGGDGDEEQQEAAAPSAKGSGRGGRGRGRGGAQVAAAAEEPGVSGGRGRGAGRGGSSVAEKKESGKKRARDVLDGTTPVDTGNGTNKKAKDGEKEKKKKKEKEDPLKLLKAHK